MKSLIEKIFKNYYNTIINIEHRRISKIIQSLFADKKIRLLDIGSGMCSFLQYARKQHSNIEFAAVDINTDLVNVAKNLGFDSQQASITKLPFEDCSFDIVHCSHVIEHLQYPDIATALDEIFRIVKKDGLIIIRSPLAINHRFFNDIDHVRPYPPLAIISYFSNPQQQKTGAYSIKEISRYYTRVAFEINYYRYYNFLTRILNIIFKISWTYIRFPFSKPNNYGLFIKKLT
jgi:ubiquinone/menaquinone biosynthesis C-methylase UbiE